MTEINCDLRPEEFVARIHQLDPLRKEFFQKELPELLRKLPGLKIRESEKEKAGIIAWLAVVEHSKTIETPRPTQQNQKDHQRKKPIAIGAANPVKPETP